jgi:calcineurin-like phosphoesterase family protein
MLPPGMVGNKKTILLTHKPRIGLSSDMVNIHGHIHEQLLDPTVYEIDRYFNVSVENINYTPIELQEIIKRMDW